MIPGADAPAEAELVLQREGPQRAARRIERDPEPQVHDAQPGCAGGLARALPLRAHVREEAGAARAGLVEPLTPAVAVEPDGGRTQERGSSRALDECLGDETRRSDSARE